MKPNEYYSDMSSLSQNEMLETNAGESAWYWAAYGVGAIGRGIVYVWNYCEEHPLEGFNA